MFKRLIPVIIAVALIIVIGGIGFFTILLPKYSYSKETMDLAEYYGLTAPDEVAIILQDEVIETRAYLKQGVHYMDLESVKNLLNHRFYEDKAEQLLIFTTPTQIIRTVIGSNTYLQGEQEIVKDYPLSFYDNGVLYLALDYVHEFTNFHYEAFTEPYRIQMDTEWSEAEMAEISRNTAVRYRGGIKSDILRQLTKGEQVTVLEELENWSEIKTNDGIIGYVENKRLKNKATVTEIPAAHYEEPEYTSLVRDYKINLGWHQVGAKIGNSTLEEVLAGTQALNVISPTWFSLSDNEGGIQSFAEQGYVDRVHGLGMEVWALVDNFDKNVSSYEVLSRTTSRTRLIENLMNEVLHYGIDGINVDFEDLSYEEGEPFIQFMRELSIQCRLHGIVLSSDNYVPRASTTHYDRKEQGVVADYVIIMGYDEHWGGGGIAGSVASIGFVEDGIAQTVEEVPPHKVINALPFYTRVWKTQDGKVTSEAVAMGVAQSFVANNGVEVGWDAETCQNYGEKQLGNAFYQVWLEDAQSIETKLTIMKKYDLGGVAAWKLGLETDDIWNLISAYTNS